jgi:two-component system, NtrC family, sensor kinase
MTDTAAISEKPAPARVRRLTTVRILRVLAAASLIVPLVILVSIGWLDWNEKRQEASNDTMRLLELVSDSTTKLFDLQVLALQQTKLLLNDHSDAEIRQHQAELHDNLTVIQHYLPFLRDLFVVDKNGMTLLSAATFPPPTKPLTDRDYYQYFRQGHGGTFIGQLGRRYVDETSYIPLAIARPSLDGGFNGVIVCSINPDDMKVFFEQLLAMDPDIAGRSVSLLRDDGGLVVGAGNTSAQAEQIASATAQFAVRQQDTDTGLKLAQQDDESRIAAWYRLPTLRMVVVTSVSLNDVRDAWLRSMEPYAGLCAASALSLLALSLLALRRTHASIAAEEQAERERQRRQQAEDAVRQSQKMEALGKLTGGVAHDFNNLLAVIQGNAELAKNRPPEKVARMLDNILHASQRGATLTRQLLSFSRGQALAPRVMDPTVEIPRIMTMLQASLRGDIQVGLSIAPDVWPVEVDLAEWEIALLNIAVNARDAMPSGGHLTVAAANVVLNHGDMVDARSLEGPFVRLTMRDTGSGIPSDVAARAFEPFFTTKDVGSGTGLGLSQVYGFARQSHGVATIATAPQGGTEVTLFLPKAVRALSRVEAEAPAVVHAVDRGARQILLVEDNPEVATITSEIIRTLGYQVVHVDRARKGLEMLTRSKSSFQLMITDVVMPDGMDGVQLATAARRLLPSLPIILVSGYNEAGSANSSGFRLLRKPLPVKDLAEAIEAELGGFPRIVVDNTKAG